MGCQSKVKDCSVMCFSFTIFDFAFWMWPTECKELPWNDPVQVSILCPLIVLIFFHIKVREVQPVILQSLKDVRRELISFAT